MSLLSHANHVLASPAEPNQLWHYLLSAEHAGVIFAAVLSAFVIRSFGSNARAESRTQTRDS